MNPPDKILNKLDLTQSSVMKLTKNMRPKEPDPSAGTAYPHEVVVKVVKLLVGGKTIREAARVAGVSRYCVSNIKRIHIDAKGLL
jgi:hypothetical protein